MDYELALKLKNAGFPQDYHDCVGDENGCICNDERIIKDVTIPTLSELIEVCGYKFLSVGKDEFMGEWIAFSEGEKYGRGSTPEEAVANLWLELNKK